TSFLLAVRPRGRCVRRWIRRSGTGVSPRVRERSRSWSYRSGVTLDEEKHWREQWRAETTPRSGRVEIRLVGSTGSVVAAGNTDCPGCWSSVLVVAATPGPAELPGIDHDLEHSGSDRATPQLWVLAGCAGSSHRRTDCGNVGDPGCVRDFHWSAGRCDRGADRG